MGSGTYWLAFGVLIGFGVALFAPGFVKALVIVFDLVALGWASGILNFADHSKAPWVLIAVVFLLLGLFLGVTRGLKHLSESEMRTRQTNIRRIGRYF